MNGNEEKRMCFGGFPPEPLPPLVSTIINFYNYSAKALSQISFIYLLLRMEADELAPAAYEVEKQHRIFVLGLCLLFGWVAVMALFCAYPQLFRNFLFRYICCFFGEHQRNRGFNEEVYRAKERMRSASRSFINVSMAANPSAILFNQQQVALYDDFSERNADNNTKQIFDSPIILNITEPIYEIADEMDYGIEHCQNNKNDLSKK